MPGTLPSIPAPPSDQTSLLSWAAVVTTYLRNLRDERGKVKDEFLESSDKKKRRSGYASLDSTGKIPTEQINATDTSGFQVTSEKDTASGYAGLDANGFLTKRHPLLHVQDEKTAGTHGGAFTLGAWRTRTLNSTAETNEITGATAGATSISLPAGIYFAEWSAPGFFVDSHKSRLQDTTNGTTLLFGSAEWSDNTVGGHSSNRSVGCGRFTLSGTATLEVQHRSSATQATNGFGAPASFGQIEVYTILKVWRLSL